MPLEVLVCYDVSTESENGRKRLRRVAKACEAYGQRVQKSVFECVLSAADFARLKHRLLGEIDKEEDSLRIYRLLEPRESYVEVLGRQLAYDIHDPLVL
jgi:CRISPR-associated protein Cas2